MIGDGWSEFVRLAFAPRSWEIRTRRLFLIFLPIALPLWLVWMALLLLTAALFVIWQPVIQFWNAPPRRRASPYVYHVDRPQPPPLRDASPAPDAEQATLGRIA